MQTLNFNNHILSIIENERSRKTKSDEKTRKINTGRDTYPPPTLPLLSLSLFLSLSLSLSLSRTKHSIVLV